MTMLQAFSASIRQGGFQRFARTAIARNNAAHVQVFRACSDAFRISVPSASQRPKEFSTCSRSNHDHLQQLVVTPHHAPQLTPFSALKPTHIDRWLTNFKLKRHSEDFRPLNGPVDEMAVKAALKDEFVWTKLETKSVEEYTTHIQQLVDAHSPGAFATVPVDSARRLLNTDLPCESFDIVLERIDGRSSDDGPLANITCSIELKPRITDALYRRKYAPQASGQLLALSALTSAPVFAVLTDLRMDWTFFWVSHVDGEDRFNQVRFKTREQGVRALYSVLARSPEEHQRAIGVCSLKKAAGPLLLKSR